MKRITKSDYLEREPAIEELADRLRDSSGPQLVARITREYWWSVEYVEWTDGRWYGCVRCNNDDNEWETTDAGDYSADQVYGVLADAVNDDHPYTLQFIPKAESPI